MKELLKLILGDFAQSYTDRKRDHYELQILTTDLAYEYYTKRVAYNKNLDWTMDRLRFVTERFRVKLVSPSIKESALLYFKQVLGS